MDEYKKIKISMLGIRGLPPRYGGSETCVDELCRRLHYNNDIIVFCRNHNIIKDQRLKEYNGATLVHLPSIDTKNLDTITHSFLSILYILFNNTSDIIHFHGAGNSLLFPLLFLSKKKVIVTVDGADWERKKWSRIARFFLKISAFFAVRFADIIVADSPVAENIYKKRFRRYKEKIVYIPYGANIEKIEEDKEVLKEFNLIKGNYILFVGRLIPEKGVHYLIDAFEKVNTNLNLVIVGDNKYNREYVRKLKNRDDKRIIFTGNIFGNKFKTILKNCLFYVQPSEVEGTSPILLTAMGYGKCVIVNGIPENILTIGKAGIYFKKNDVDDLKNKIELLLNSRSLIESYGRKALKRVMENYSWDKIANDYEKIYKNLCRKFYK